MQVKIFKDTNIKKLEHNVNNWLKKITTIHEIVTITQSCHVIPYGDEMIEYIITILYRG